MAVFAGVGYLTVESLLEDVSYALIEPIVVQAFPAPITAGVRTIAVYDPSIYVGCQLVAGAGTANVEVITVTATSGTSFTATFANAHAAGDSIRGATFPVRWPTDQFFTQSEMLEYVATAVNDFLADCPLIVAVTESVSVAPSAQVAALPADCMTPVRIAAYGYPLRETSQSNLDSMDYRWQQQAATGPYAYFRDKVGLGNVGVFPRANNTTPLEIVYQQRGAETVGFADGFILPDCFLLYIKYRVLEFAYSKDGEMRQPGLAKYYAGRYATGVKISNVFLGVVNDPNLEMSST